MIHIPIGDSGLSAIMDDADELLVAGFNWYIYQASDRLFYARAWNGKQSYLMHRLISGCAANERVDHENRNGLDNRRRNLRIATPSQNGANRIPDRRKRGRTSQYKGVYLDRARGKWGATIHVNGKTRILGRYATEEEAAAAYDRAAAEAWGRFARLNLED